MTVREPLTILLKIIIISSPKSNLSLILMAEAFEIKDSNKFNSLIYFLFYVLIRHCDCSRHRCYDNRFAQSGTG